VYIDIEQELFFCAMRAACCGARRSSTHCGPGTSCSTGECEEHRYVAHAHSRTWADGQARRSMDGLMDGLVD